MTTPENKPTENKVSSKGSKENTIDSKENTIDSINLIKNKWNTSQEKILQDWGEQCKSLSWMHYQASKKYKKYNTRLNIASIILSGIAGTGSFINVECDSYLSLTLGTLAMLSSISIASNQFLKFNELYVKHKQSSNKFLGLANEIEYQMAFERENRQEPSKFIEDCKKLYDTIISESLDVPDSIIEKYNKTFTNSELTKPQIANGVYVIDIRNTLPTVN